MVLKYAGRRRRKIVFVKNSCYSGSRVRSGVQVGGEVVMQRHAGELVREKGGV